jgi:Ca-activated chloride channel homolog
VDTNLVAVPVCVMDRDGRYVTNLKKEDFQIFEDGAEQELSFFAPVEQSFTILFLFDMSASMTYRVPDLARAPNAFADQLRPDDQLMAVANPRINMIATASVAR